MFEFIVSVILSALPLISTGSPESPAPVVCGEVREDTEVTRIAADEIFRLTSLGYPACQVTWDFTDTMDDAYLGLAYDNDRNFVQINTDAATHTQGGTPLDAMVRHVVRHEFGHQVVFVSYTGRVPENDPALFRLFTGQEKTAYNHENGHELAADMIAAALGDDRAAYDSQRIQIAQDMLDNTPSLY